MEDRSGDQHQRGDWHNDVLVVAGGAMTLLLALLALPALYVLTLALLGAYLENLPALGLSVLVVVALIAFALVIA